MASLNKVFLMGNLTRDPDIRYTPSGAAVTDVGLAVNRKYKAASGEMKEEVCFVSVTIWGNQAKACAEYLKKGSPLFVEGRLQLDEWEKDGQKHSRLRVVAERTQFIGGGSRSGGGRDEGGYQRDADRSSEDTSPGDEDDGRKDSDDLPF